MKTRGKRVRRLLLSMLLQKTHAEGKLYVKNSKRYRKRIKAMIQHGDQVKNYFNHGSWLAQSKWHYLDSEPDEGSCLIINLPERQRFKKNVRANSNGLEPNYTAPVKFRWTPKFTWVRRVVCFHTTSTLHSCWVDLQQWNSFGLDTLIFPTSVLLEILFL